MSILLAKGQKIDLTKTNPGLKKVKVALGWDAQARVGETFDLDVMVAMCDLSGKMPQEGDFIFYGNTKHISGSVIHSGDNRDGQGNGDDEVINIDFNLIPSNIEKLVFAINIYEGNTKRQNFGQVRNAYARVINAESNTELMKFDLGEDFSVETCVIACELYRHNGEWKFNAVGTGYHNGIDGFIKEHGQDVR
jgi:tellurium resistance protein TerD